MIHSSSDFVGVVRKRIIPFTTIRPDDVGSKENFNNFECLQRNQRQIMDALVAEYDKVLHVDKLGTYSQMLAEKKCKMSIIKENIVNRTERKKVGDVLCVDDTGTLGLALVRIEELLSASILSILVETGEDQEEGITVYTFMPEWWPVHDPVTGKNILNN